MRKMITMIVVVGTFICINMSLVCAQATPPCSTGEVKTADVDKDGKADVTYFHDGKNVTKAEADTNYDGKSDVVVNVKDGQFESAEIDTDYNGSLDKKITDAVEFKNWVNENRPVFNESLSPSGWQLGSIKF